MVWRKESTKQGKYHFTGQMIPKKNSRKRLYGGGEIRPGRNKPPKIPQKEKYDSKPRGENILSTKKADMECTRAPQQSKRSTKAATLGMNPGMPHWQATLRQEEGNKRGENDINKRGEGGRMT